MPVFVSYWTERVRFCVTAVALKKALLMMACMKETDFFVSIERAGLDGA